MLDQTLLYWGMVVTIFILFAALLTARELFERYLERRANEKSAGRTENADPAQPRQ